MKNRTMKLLFCTLVLVFSSLPAHADDDNWGCTVFLCLANPQGPTAAAACVPPINKLWSELAKGHDFPSCDTGSSSSSVQNQWASPSYCPPQYIAYRTVGDGATEQYCTYSGAVTVNINNQPFTRVWWNGADSVTENLSDTAAQTPGASQRFAEDYAKWKIQQDAIEAANRCTGDC
jgi:hypothetical protein